jgi:hypothetical protein
VVSVHPESLGNRAQEPSLQRARSGLGHLQVSKAVFGPR